MEIPKKGVKYTCPFEIIQKAQIGRIAGDTSIDGTLHLDSIATNSSDVIQMGNTNFTSLSINGNRIVPSDNNIEADMKFTTKNAKVYVAKCKAGKHTAEDTIAGTGTKVPEVVVDINFSGSVYYITIRPFFIVGEDLIKIYAPTSATGTGAGCIILPFENQNQNGEVILNPYSFNIMDSKDSNDPEIILPKGISSVETDSNGNQIYKTDLCATNKYIVGKTSFAWIKTILGTTFPLNMQSTDVVWDYGTITYYITEECGTCVNMQWEWETDNKNYAGNYAKPSGATTAKERQFIVVGGTTFTALRRNTKENLGFYAGKKSN